MAMHTLTVSTNGMGKRPYAAPADESTTPSCHDVSDIEHIRYAAGQFDRSLVALTISTDQALAIAYDLLYQAVDAGAISGWNVSFPERDEPLKTAAREVFEDVRITIKEG